MRCVPILLLVGEIVLHCQPDAFLQRDEPKVGHASFNQRRVRHAFSILTIRLCGVKNDFTIVEVSCDALREIGDRILFSR